ncbi:MAG: hypothetical protein HY791_16335 [Deltaproteobacteria bacterium]|nr:hypothetical protein [Deltaproteobacteria bacterium]
MELSTTETLRAACLEGLHEWDALDAAVSAITAQRASDLASAVPPAMLSDGFFEPSLITLESSMILDGLANDAPTYWLPSDPIDERLALKLADAIRAGHVPGGRVVDILLARLATAVGPRAFGFRILFERTRAAAGLGDEEFSAQFRDRLYGLVGSPVGEVASLGLMAAKLDSAHERAMTAIGPALQHSAKSVVLRALRILSAHLEERPDLFGLIADDLVAGLGHPKADVARAIAEWLVEHRSSLSANALKRIEREVGAMPRVTRTIIGELVGPLVALEPSAPEVQTDPSQDLLRALAAVPSEGSQLFRLRRESLERFVEVGDFTEPPRVGRLAARSPLQDGFDRGVELLKSADRADSRDLGLSLLSAARSHEIDVHDAVGPLLSARVLDVFPPTRVVIASHVADWVIAHRVSGADLARGIRDGLTQDRLAFKSFETTLTLVAQRAPFAVAAFQLGAQNAIAAGALNSFPSLTAKRVLEWLETLLADSGRAVESAEAVAELTRRARSQSEAGRIAARLLARRPIARKLPILVELHTGALLAQPK